MTLWRVLFVYGGSLLFFIPLGMLSLRYYIATYRPSPEAVDKFLSELSFPFDLYRRYRGYFGIDDTRSPHFNTVFVRYVWAVLMVIMVFNYILLGFVRSPDQRVTWLVLACVYLLTFVIFWRFGSKLRHAASA